MMHPAEPDARPQSTLWMLDLGQPLPVGPTLRVPAAFKQAGPEVAQELAQAMDLDCRLHLFLRTLVRKTDSQRELALDHNG